MTKSFNVIIEKDEDGYFVATVPSLRGCHTQAKSLDKLMERTKEAIELCLEVEKEVVTNEFIGVQRLSVSLMSKLSSVAGKALIKALKRAGLRKLESKAVIIF